MRFTASLGADMSKFLMRFETLTARHVALLRAGVSPPCFDYTPHLPVLTSQDV